MLIIDIKNKINNYVKENNINLNQVMLGLIDQINWELKIIKTV